MDTKRVTLRDIAQKMDVSLSTVHKALYDKKGVGEKTRLAILETARQMNFKINITASSLKRKSIKIAVVVPEPVGEERYFYKDFWKGIEDAETALKDFNVELLKVPFKGIDYKQQAKLLESILDAHAESLDGLLTVPWNISKLDSVLNRFSDANIPVVTVNTDAPASKRICCVAPPAEKIGMMAGELMGKMIQAPGKVLIFSGNREIKLHVELSRGFVKRMAEDSPSVEIIEIIDNSPDGANLEKSLREFLSNFGDIRGIYSNNARNTLLVGRVVSDMGLANKLKIIGTDLFDESIAFLEKDVIHAIIYQNPYLQSYEAINLLFHHIVNWETVTDYDFHRIAIVLKSNLSFYAKSKES